MKELSFEQMEKKQGGTCTAGIGLAWSTGLLGVAAIYGPAALLGAVMIACVAGDMLSNRN